MIHKTIELAKPAHEVFRWLHHLGGPGLIVLGLIDNSVIPVPGSMDALTIILSANQRKLWPYYALMATIGSVIGGYRHLPHFISSRQRRNGTQIFPQTDQQGHENIREVGFWRSFDSCDASAAGAHGSISHRSGRYAILAQ